VFGTVRAVINFAISEQGLSLQNPFNGVYFDRAAGVSDRHPIQQAALTFCAGRVLQDQRRYAMAGRQCSRWRTSIQSY